MRRGISGQTQLILLLIVLLLVFAAFLLAYARYRRGRSAYVTPPTPTTQTAQVQKGKIRWGHLDLSNKAESDWFAAMQSESQRILTEDAKAALVFNQETVGLSVPYPVVLDMDANMAEARKAFKAQKAVQLKPIWRIDDSRWADWYKALQQRLVDIAHKSDEDYDLTAPAVEQQVKDYLLKGDWSQKQNLQVVSKGKKGDPAFAGLTLVSEAASPNVNAAPGRDANLKRAAELLNGVKILPGQTISYMQTIGPITYENGYRDAGIQADGMSISGLGGGLCQPSSTLFQACVLAGDSLTFPVRFNHSIPVPYCKLGEDAMVSDWADFMIRNNSDVTFTIQAIFDGEQFLVRIYGKPLPEGVTCQMFVEHLGYIEPGPDVFKQNPNIPAGELKRVRKRVVGQKTMLYRQYFKDGQVIRNEKVALSTYEAFSAIYEYSDFNALTPEQQAMFPADQRPAGSAEETKPEETTETTAAPETQPTGDINQPPASTEGDQGQPNGETAGDAGQGNTDNGGTPLYP